MIGPPAKAAIAGSLEYWSCEISTDVIEASAKAYLNGVNKLLLGHKKKSAKAAFEAMKGVKL